MAGTARIEWVNTGDRMEDRRGTRAKHGRRVSAANNPLEAGTDGKAQQSRIAGPLCGTAYDFEVLRLKQGCNCAALFEVLRLELWLGFRHENALSPMGQKAFFAMKQSRGPGLSFNSRSPTDNQSYSRPIIIGLGTPYDLFATGMIKLSAPPYDIYDISKCWREPYP